MSPSRETRENIAVVLCDDQPAVAQGLARVLEAERDDLTVVGIATDADQAEAMVKDTLPDVVVMDIYMPRVDGIEATRRIRASSPTTQVVVLTVSDREEDLYRAIKAGALAYVTKDKDRRSSRKRSSPCSTGTTRCPLILRAGCSKTSTKWVRPIS